VDLQTTTGGADMVRLRLMSDATTARLGSSLQAILSACKKHQSGM